jgi:spore coat polysaccharide biosynthesis protein SpsF
VRIVAIVQARMGSTRLPGKILQDLLPGRSALSLLLERLSRVRSLATIVVATPDGPADEPVRVEANRLGVEVFAGSETDVLGRYVGAARAARADLVVRITSDCPLVDAGLVEQAIDRMRTRLRQIDFVTNARVRTFPLGLALEVMPIDTLMRMDRLSVTPYLREHVTTLAYERPELFVIDDVAAPADRSAWRWTLDYPSDLEFARAVYQALYSRDPRFTTADIEALLAARPDLIALDRAAAAPPKVAPV